jgi:hypothetical protein
MGKLNRIDEIRERLEKATKGWRQDDVVEHYIVWGEEGERHFVCSAYDDFIPLIAHTPDDLRFLLARVGELESFISNHLINYTCSDCPNIDLTETDKMAASFDGGSSEKCRQCLLNKASALLAKEDKDGK